MPVLFLILFGIIEYGWYMINQIVLTNAVSEGARAAVGTTSDDADTVAVTAVKSSFWLTGFEADGNNAFMNNGYLEDLEGEPIVATYNENSDPPTITVTARLSFPQITGFMPEGTIPRFLAAKSVMAFP
jgi:Flp pilus assembly protein TadG